MEKIQISRFLSAMNRRCSKHNLAVFIILLAVSLLPASPVLANNQTWVFGFYNFHTEEVLFKEHNSFYNHVDNPTPNAFDVGPLLLNRLYLEWYLWKKHGMGFTVMSFLGNSYHMDKSEDSPFKTSDKDNVEFSINNYLATFSSVWLGEDSYWRFGTIVGGGLSEYSLRSYTDSTRPGDVRESFRTVNGPALTAGAFLDWGGDGFGARLGIMAVSSWYPHLVYNDCELNVNTTYISRYIDLRWAW